MKSALLKSALKYTELGWHIFPCHSITNNKCSCGNVKCKNPGKHPRTHNGLKAATTDPEKIRKWWKKWPDANLAVRTGPESVLAVLDIDVKGGGPYNLDFLESRYEPLPETLVAQTGGGGKHYFFKYSGDGFKCSANEIHSGIDTRGDGGYVLVEPSNHISGEKYHWIDHEPGEVELAEIPTWILEKLTKKKQKTRNSKGSGTKSEKVTEGSRNNHLTSEAGKLRRIGMDFEAIYAALLVINQNECDPPLDESEVRQIAKSVSRYEPGHHPSLPYVKSHAGIVWVKPTKNGPTPQPLTNFYAKISSQIARDDGAETIRYFEIESTLNYRKHCFLVSAAEFSSLNWVTRELGATALVYPGYTAKDHTRAAIQMLSGNIPSTTEYGHLGWRKIGKEWLYLHTGGALGKDGNVESIAVKTDHQNLKYYSLWRAPQKGEEAIAIIKAVLSLLKLAPHRIVLTLIASVFRAPLGDLLPIDFSIFYVGSTGCQKTEITALGQSFFGSEFHGKNLPGNWSSTANYLEKMAFLAKDAIFTVDDFAPAGTQSDIARQHRDAARLLRGQGNLAGRGRMDNCSKLRTTYCPRSLIISSGEDIPRGQSIRARTAIIEMSRGDVNLELLTTAQTNAADGIFSKSLSGYIQWLAPQFDDLKKRLKKRKQELRDKARQSYVCHDRTPDVVANLMVGWKMFLTYCLESGAISSQENEKLQGCGWETFCNLAKSQAQHQANEEPVTRFCELLVAGLSSGRGHVCSMDGDPPNVDVTTESQIKWGWTLGGGTFEDDLWKPQGPKIGWVDDDGNIFLQNDAVFAMVQKLATEQGTSFSINQDVLWKRLDEKNLIATKASGRLKIRKMIERTRRYVIHMKASSIYPRDSG